MFGSFGFPELLIILAIIMIIFGVGKLPQIGEGLGKAIRGFKKGVSDSEGIDASTQKPKEELPKENSQKEK
jgi:sec-independent protein translocase protein TatA